MRSLPSNIDILEVRKSFHAFIDPIWKSGACARDSIYKKMDKVLGREAHVSKMSLEDIEKCAEVLLTEYETLYPCKTCAHCVGVRHFIPVCKKNVERIANRCELFRDKRERT